MALRRRIPAGDLEIENGRLIFCSGERLVRQKLAARFNFFKGEWFLDQRQGIPYLRDVFVMRPNRDLILALFRRVIITTPGVASAENLVLTPVPGTRKAQFSFRAVLKNGGVIDVPPTDDAFLVDIAA